MNSPPTLKTQLAPTTHAHKILFIVVPLGMHATNIVIELMISPSTMSINDGAVSWLTV